MGPTHYVLCDLVQQVPGSSPGCDGGGKEIMKVYYHFLCSSMMSTGLRKCSFYVEVEVEMPVYISPPRWVRTSSGTSCHQRPGLYAITLTYLRPT